MPDIRTTRVALLVDREVDRDVRTSRVALLVDRETDTTVVLEDIYLVADIEDGSPWGDLWQPTSTYDFTVQSSGTHRDWEDLQDLVDDFLYEVFVIVRELADIWEPIQAYGHVHPWIDSQDQTDTFGLTYARDWQDIQTQTQVYYNPPIYQRPWQETWGQAQSFTSALQRLMFSDQQTQTDQWNNPGNRLVSLPNTQAQSDTFATFSDRQQWSDVQAHDDSWDPSFPAKVRGWADIQHQTGRWDTTNLADYWVQTDQFQLGAIPVTLSQTWSQTDIFRPPYRLMVAQTWSQSETWYVPVINTDLSQTWPQSDAFSSRAKSAALTDTWTQVDQFQPLLYTENFSDYLDQTDNFRSLTQSVSINQSHLDFEEVAGFTAVTGMVDYFDYVVPDPEREFKHTVNWFERWSVVLPTEELADIQTPTDEFVANPIWHDFADTQIPQETWHQLSGHFYDDIFYQTSVFTREHHARLPWTSTWAPVEAFSYYQQARTCTIPYGLFTLIDEIETLPLRNARWGDKDTLETQRVVGITRSGAPFVGRRPYWPQREVFTYTIRALSDEQLDQVLNFLERNIGKQIWWIDHYGKRYRGFCQEPATPAVRKSRGRGKIELILVSLGDPECPLHDHFLQQEEYAWQL